ncbi:MAG: hypothetical protein A2W91_00840 [Bacteroidetes bacterium GWF2_38_335]|nr:MAG: hypothetical protein A2W91_00840 [Bacteroidetes bacterium GWF2_38_335]OFY80302.1 MAG: hypothetical protein A2281_17350 [Bacteroidetes bacterium RIFOXYA12_FULL_38_20]HBS88899.1 hypothetical protein [Bacteroidales bacterium]
MGTKVIIFLLVCISLVSCKKLDPKGLFASDDPANKRFEQSQDWNTAHPAVEIITGSDSYTIFALGDSHIGETASLDSFLTEATEQNITAVLMAGDLTTGHVEDQMRSSDIINMHDTLNIFTTPGNHDLFFDGWETFFSLFGASSYYFSVKTPSASDLFICLDTGGATLGKDQFEWLKNLLESERNNFRHCIIFTHINFPRFRTIFSSNQAAEEMYTLFDLMSKHKVDMVIGAHDHERNAVQFGNTLYVTMDAFSREEEVSGYLKLEVDSENLIYFFEQ